MSTGPVLQRRGRTAAAAVFTSLSDYSVKAFDINSVRNVVGFFYIGRYLQ